MILEERIHKWIDSYDRNGYLHGSIFIASKEKIIVNKSFGMANWEHRVPNTPTTKFRIGSITKAFTAMGILLLQMKGKLNINDYVAKYLPDFPNGDRITIYHCLTNTSGIPNYTNSPDFWIRTMRLPSTLNQLIDSFKDQELGFEPGSKFEYSNSGYALLTEIIEKVSDMSYADYIREQICDPLGMYDTGCDDGIKVVSGLSSGYSFWEEPIHSAYADLSFPLGAYGLYSTTKDLFIWDQALKSSQMLNQELMDKMFTPYLNSYACGWMVSDLLGRKCVHHFGDISGFNSDFLRFVENDVTILFLSNMNVTPVTHLCREMARTLFEENVSLPLPMESIEYTNMESIVGTYGMENGTNKLLNVSIKDGELYLTVAKMYGALYKMKLVPVSQDSTTTTFLTEMIHEQLVFYYASSGEVERVKYTDYVGNTHYLYRASL